MNKTITVYELLGMIKDGKAPDKIKSEGHYYYYNVLEKDYYEGMGYDYEYLFKNISSDNLNDTVEIIEDNGKLEKIKWEEKESLAKPLMINDKVEVLARRTEKLKKKIADLINHINRLEDNQ